MRLYDSMNTELKLLLDAYLEDALTPQQEARLSAMIASGEHDAALTALLQLDFKDHKYLLPEFTSLRDRNFQRIEKLIDAKSTPVLSTPPRIPLLRRWGWVAAAVFIFVAAGTYLRLQDTQKQALATASDLAVSDIEPGKEGAILTLEDGRTVVLDSLSNGVIATQGAASVILKNGQLAYANDGAGNSLKKEEAKVLYNTMTTLRGRQFHMQLSDGTKVWLNAASSIRFPAVFTGDKREVEVSGEVYFEVVQDAARPFKVYYSTTTTTNNRQGVVEVLGTAFNINAYPDEAEVLTTLLEGAVRINQNGNSALLKPGEQAAVPVQETAATNRDKSLKTSIVVRQANLDQVSGWKKGVFNFHQTGLKAAMRQIARWYDVEVVYEPGLPPIEFAGKVQRNLSLSQIMKGLADEEIHFRIEGKKLIVFHKPIK